MQHAPLANAACCIFHSTARQYCGEASSPSKPSDSCCFLIPSEKSWQCLFSCWPVPSAARFRALSCAVLCIFLRCSVHSLEKTNGVADVGCCSGNDVGMGLWSLGLRAGASRLAGSEKSTGALKKEAQQAGLTQPLRLLVRRDRDSNPGYSHPYAAFRVRSIRPLWHLSSSGSAALPVPCARGWWWRPWSNPFRSAKLLQPFHSNKHWSEKASPGQGVFIFRADGLCSLSRGFLSFCQES